MLSYKSHAALHRIINANLFDVVIRIFVSGISDRIIGIAVGKHLLGVDCSKLAVFKVRSRQRVAE